MLRWAYLGGLRATSANAQADVSPTWHILSSHKAEVEQVPVRGLTIFTPPASQRADIVFYLCRLHPHSRAPGSELLESCLLTTYKSWEVGRRTYPSGMMENLKLPLSLLHE
jgi:hypothetical protein